METDYQKLLNACKEYRAKLDEALEANNELHDRLSTIPDEVWSKADLVKQIHQAYVERDELQKENTKLKQRILDDNKAYGCEIRDPSGTIWDYAAKLDRENAALREDKARLDWLLTHEGGAWVYWQDHGGSWNFMASATRAAIDAARKEAQP